ncbi:hypothetical protein PHYSODRAFT_337304 [Phytophthora sojae]|uniref:CCHC-type domain-containing protein n=1 Tax=Phytophthora sojae (strain P6497) TaxID=1094619 RepID=G5A0A3_PHYSP|nr:hypothetical protein PHYSODRAFT_337304 [Phytophthora sojae]EGZ10492.1 hypothetical protein PHYSODRAFT_337304 [Phytophthora sojae]|eukprot:XP_009533237.1 hypothetical protein PHYSODRAFT_337304 [Phytophthora sojae]
MEPEEHKDLETVVRDARKAKKAARESEAVQGGDGESSAVQDLPAAGSQTQEEEVSSEFQDSTEANSGSRIPEVPEEHTREGVKPEPVQAKEEAKSQSSKVNSGFAPPEPNFSAPSSQAAPRKKPEGDVREAAGPASEPGAAALDTENMVLYVRHEVRRWEEVNPGKVMPPSVVYEWPTPKPDANSYFAAAYATGDYFKWRLSLANQDEAWISEFHPARWGVGTAQDLMATTIPQNIMTARECVAILQTLFFEAGFEFVNLIPGWSTTRASRIPESLVRSVMEETQNFIAVELVEWRLVIAGVPFKVNPEDQHAPSVQDQAPRLNYRKEDGDGDLFMTDYDADLLGRQFGLKFRVTGLRISRSPRGSSDGEPRSKRTQHGPPRPQVPSTPSALPTPSLSSLPAYKSSTTKDAAPGAVPSVIGTSRASDESTASGAQTSYGSSSSSWMMSLGQRVGALALVAQIIPPRLVSVDQDDFEMASSVHSDPEIAPRKTESTPEFRERGVLSTLDEFQKISCVEPLEWIQESWVSFVRVREQEWQVRMEQEQREFLAGERLDALERERLREQRDLDARRQIQELTDRLIHAEIARGEAERHAQDVEARQTQSSTETQGMTQSITEAVRLEREHLDAAYTERWQQREAEADSERARWVSETYAGCKEQMSTMEQKVQELEAERERERESSENIQRFHAGQNPEVATRPQESSGAINGNASVAGQRRETADPKNTSEIAASQLRATLAQTSADTSGRTARGKRGHGAMETKVTQDIKLEPVSLGKTSDPRRTAASKASQDFKTDSKRSAPKKHQQQEKKRQDVNPPSDSDLSSDSSDDDSSSESSDDSLDENPGVNLTAASTAQAGTTLLTFRPYINSNTLSEFDTKASLRERVHWWEIFANMAAQGGWTKYRKARSSYSERYFTMEMKNSESALGFFYRLNSAAGKADIDFRKSSKCLEKHIRRLITKLRGTRLKTSLQGQRFRSIANLEYALEQDEDVWSRSDHDAPPPRVRDFRAAPPPRVRDFRAAPPPRVRDFRADNIPQGRFKPKRAGRAYSDENPEIHARFQEIMDEPRVSARSASANSGSTREISGEEASTPSAGSLASMKGAEWTQTLTNEVYRVIDNMGWRPSNAQPGPNANSGFRSPRRENPNRDKFCEKCGKWGHPEGNCWKDVKCDRCLEVGHPTLLCRAQPCENCGKLHLGKPCEDWKTLEAVKKVARQGALKDMPSQILDKLLDGEANFGRPSNR